MFRRMLKWTVPSLMGLALLAAAFTPVSASAEGCEEARAWVKQNARNLPTTYEAFVQQPPHYRRAMLEVLSPEVKSALWRRHFELYLEQHPALSPEQVDIVQEAHSLAGPESFRPQAREAVKASLAALRQKGEQVFELAELSRLLTKLGPAGDGGTAMMPLCECFDSFDCGGVECNPRLCSFSYGCGPFGMDSCVGVCW